MDATPEPLWTVKDVAAFLRLSRTWVYKSAEAGELPHMHVGGALRFERAAIVAWLATCASKPARCID